MNAAFITAVIDTLLPGDSGGPTGEPALPPASAAGIDLGVLAQANHIVFEAIANHSGGGGVFVAGAEPARIAAIQAIERANPDTFRALLSALLADYYESESVLTAMGWRTDPPQPRGHEMPGEESSIAKRLNGVRSRGKKWRG
jgi:hypothetical protein